MPIVSGKLARTGKVLLCINHKLMCLLLIVLGKSALRWLTISLQHHAVIYLVLYVRFIWRYNITETAPAASFIMSHSYDLAIVSYVSSVNTQPSNLQHDVALSQLFVVHQSVILPERPAWFRCRRAFSFKIKPTEPNDAKFMKITRKEKEFLLRQDQILLSECQRLVSQLSSVQCEKCPDVNQEDDVSSVQCLQSHDLLWNTSDDFPVHSTPTPSGFYTLVFNEESSDEEMKSASENCQILTKSLTPKCPLSAKLKLSFRKTIQTMFFPKKSQIKWNKKDWMSWFSSTSSKCGTM